MRLEEDDTVWHLLIDGAQSGPFNRSQVLLSIQRGTVSGTDLVWQPGFKSWLPLHEIREFWTSPNSPARAAPEDAAPLAQQRRKWSLWGAATGGLAVSSIVLWTSGLASGGYMLANTGYMPNAELVAELIGQLLAMPLLFVLIALARNIMKRKNLLPSDVSVGLRVAAFFGILILVGVSLRVFGTYYFSRDQLIDGEARSDLTKSFFTGCFRSQRMASSNTSVADTQIESYCKCIGEATVSALTYKQMSSADFAEHVKAAVTQAAPSCRTASN